MKVGSSKGVFPNEMSDMPIFKILSSTDERLNECLSPVWLPKSRFYLVSNQTAVTCLRLLLQNNTVFSHQSICLGLRLLYKGNPLNLVKFGRLSSKMTSLFGISAEIGFLSIVLYLCNLRTFVFGTI